MTVQPESGGTDTAERPCPECGRPIETDADVGTPFTVCRSCYEAPVENAGR